jgi:hypothetical protein
MECRIPKLQGEQMLIVTPTIIAALVAVTQGLPIGTNLALLHVLWALVSGQLLKSRGALFPALQAIGLKEPAVRRAWNAFRYGSWVIDELLAAWQAYVQDETGWVVHRYEGYRPTAIDLTAFWRPTLKDAPSKHYHSQAGKALPAIVLGLVGRVGHLDSQRLLLPTAIVRVDPDDPSEQTLQENLLGQAAAILADDEVVVLDAGFKVAQLQEAGIGHFVIRLAKNFTARRNSPAPYRGRGRPSEYGELVRPLARSYRGNLIEATPPDWATQWEVKGGMVVTAEIWEDLVLNDQRASLAHQTFRVMAIHDPRYADPLLLGVSLDVQPISVLGLYHDRWPVEGPPLVAKQMIGAHRQFVSAPESCQRLPELALLAGSILAFLAASIPAIPTGFWDRNPQPTPGRLRRALTDLPFPNSCPLPARFRVKRSVTDHLLTGILGHRRLKQAA